MPRVEFTQNLQRHVKCPPTEAPGSCVREVLDHALEKLPGVRGYVLDEHGAVRKHVILFVNGQPVRDRENLSDPVPPEGTVYVMQALSGG